MQEIRPDTRTNVLLTMVGAIVGLPGYLSLSRSFTTGTGIEWGSLVFSLFFLTVTLFGILGLLTGLPYLRWNGRLIVYTGIFGRVERYLLSEFGPAVAVSALLPRGGHVHLLCLKRLADGKVIWLSVPNRRMRPDEVVSMAEAINLARGLPPGTTDLVAVGEIQKAEAAQNR